eukprot:m.170605 g.170605  ORF g.170605 m.170605 type:complete len:528 (+) comp15340_c0_seq13:316-1899(+)
MTMTTNKTTMICLATVLLLHGTVATSSTCSLKLNLADKSRLKIASGVGSGILNGMNGTSPSDDVISRIKPKMWRGPLASWLWPNRESCTGYNTCCNDTACIPPYTEANRIKSLGIRQQYILNNIHYGQTSCEWYSFHQSPHNCSLPGGPQDPDLAMWTKSVRAAALQAKRIGLTDVGFDVWNEPNGQMKVQCMLPENEHICYFDANLTMDRFLALYDKAYSTIKGILPDARVIAPSIADGGPGLNGFNTSVFPWLQQFLRHTTAQNNTPDVLTWHVSVIGNNASLLEDNHRQLRAWASLEGVKLNAIGHNEVIGPQSTLSPAGNLAFLVTLEDLNVDHAARACWPDSVTSKSACWDNSLDALLTDDCNATLEPDCDTLQPRSNYFVYEVYAKTAGQSFASIRTLSESTPCENVDGFITINESGNITVALGTWKFKNASDLNDINIMLDLCDTHDNEWKNKGNVQADIYRIQDSGRAKGNISTLALAEPVQVYSNGSIGIRLQNISLNDVVTVNLFRTGNDGKLSLAN